MLDLIRYLLGDYESVQALTETFIKQRPLAGKADERKAVGVDDLTLMTVRMANGAVGTVEASRLATGTNDELRLEIHGSHGALRFNLMDPNWLYVYNVREASVRIGGDRGFKAIETVQRYPPPAVLPGPKFSVGWMCYHIASQYDFITSLIKGQPTSPWLRGRNENTRGDGSGLHLSKRGSPDSPTTRMRSLSLEIRR